MKVTRNKYKHMLPTEYPKCLVSPEGCRTLYSMLMSSLNPNILHLTISPHPASLYTCSSCSPPFAPSLSACSANPFPSLFWLKQFASKFRPIHPQHPLSVLVVWYERPFSPSSRSVGTAVSERSHPSHGTERWSKAGRCGGRWGQDKAGVMERRGTGAEYSQL